MWLSLSIVPLYYCTSPCACLGRGETGDYWNYREDLLSDSVIDLWAMGGAVDFPTSNRTSFVAHLANGIEFSRKQQQCEANSMCVKCCCCWWAISQQTMVRWWDRHLRWDYRSSRGNVRGGPHEDWVIIIFVCVCWCGWLMARIQKLHDCETSEDRGRHPTQFLCVRPVRYSNVCGNISSKFRLNGDGVVTITWPLCSVFHDIGQHPRERTYISSIRYPPIIPLNPLHPRI